MEKGIRYVIPIVAIICSLSFLLSYNLKEKRISQIREDLSGFAIEASRLPLSSDWKELIENENYPNLDYEKLEIAPFLTEFPKGKPYIIYRDLDRTYEVYPINNILIYKNKT